MVSYEALDALADSYTPVLALFMLVGVGRAYIRDGLNAALGALAVALALVAIAYGVMFIDRFLGIWKTFGLDYSTHTAVALVLVVFLVRNLPRQALLWGVSLCFYLILMLYQQYHTSMDILTTVAVVLPLAWLVIRLHSARADAMGSTAQCADE